MQIGKEVNASAVSSGSIYSRLVRANISHGAFRLWHLLRDHRNSNSGLAWPSQTTISKLMRCKVHSIKKWTDELVAGDFLKVEKRGQRHYLVYRFPLALPQRAERENSGTAQTGNATNLAMPIWASPRHAHMGRQSESNDPNISISNSKLFRKQDSHVLEYIEDGYILTKVHSCPALAAELVKGKTKLCSELNELYHLNHRRACELVHLAMEKSSPGAWLNTAVSNELNEIVANPHRY